MKGSDYVIVKEKLDQAVELMKEKEIDTWLILTREGSDPALPLLIGVRSVHQAAIFLRQSGDHLVIASQSDTGSYEATGLFKEVRTYEGSVEEMFIPAWAGLQIKKLALNISEQDHLCDGLTYGLYCWLQQTIGKEELSRLEISSEEILSELRSIKTKSEIKALQAAIQITTDIFEAVHLKMQAYMSEQQIGELFVEEMRARGVTSGLGSAYEPPLVCAVRHGLAHRKPSQNIVEPGDIVIIDFSLKYEDYVSDIARTFYFLKPGETQAPDDIQHAFSTAHEAITTVIEEIAAGKKGHEIDLIGRGVIEKAGYPTIRHSVGHQIGRATHDGGTILGPRREPPRKAVEGTIRESEVYAIEPTVIQDQGLPSILVEENVLITQEGAQILSKRQNELLLVKS